MRGTTICSLLLAAFVVSQDAGKYTILNTRKLANGKEVQTIQEHYDDLPELPDISQDNQEIPFIPPLPRNEEDDGVMVPVDEEGRIIPGFEHLIRPKVIIINREQLERLNNSKPVQSSSSKDDGIVISETGPIEPFPPNENIVVASTLRPAESNDISGEVDGTDYDEAAEPDLKLPTVQDYIDSKEKDPNVETVGDGSITEEDLEKIEEELEDKKEQNAQLDDENTNSSKDNTEDVKAVEENAEEEIEEVDIKDAVKEIFEKIGSDLMKEGAEDDEKKEEENEDILRKEPELPSIPMSTSDKKMETKEEKGELAGEETKPEGYVLDDSPMEEPEGVQKKAEERTPTRLHKGEIIGRRGKPDSAPCNSYVSLVIFVIVLFN